MEREGFDIPLLIGGATTSRTHTAVKIEPTISAARPPMCWTPAARWAWSPACCRRRAPEQQSPRRAPNTCAGARALRARGRPRSPHPDRRGPRQRAPRSTGRATRRRSPASSARAPSPLRPGRACPPHRLDAVLPAGSWSGAFRASWRTTWWARRRAPVRRRPGHAER